MIFTVVLVISCKTSQIYNSELPIGKNFEFVCAYDNRQIYVAKDNEGKFYGVIIDLKNEDINVVSYATAMTLSDYWISLNEIEKEKP